MESTKRVFRRGLVSQCLIPGCLLALAATMSGLTWLNPENSSGKISLVLVLTGMAMLIWSVRHYSCIVTGPDGVLLKRVGYTMFSTWENVIDIEYRTPAIIELKNPALQTRIPAFLRPCIIAWQDQLSYPGCGDSLARGNLITLNTFNHHIQSGELRGAIRQYWPRVDVNVTEPQSPLVYSNTQHIENTVHETVRQRGRS